MCGRVSSTLRAADVERATGVRARLERDDDYAADRDAAADAFDAHSACPGARLFTMVRRRCDGAGATDDDDDATWRDAMAIQRMTWGIYRGARPRDESMRARATYERAYNARGETLKELALFRSARQCATLANGFFEWRDESIGGGKTIKQPYYVTRADGEPLVIASVYVDEIASGSGSGKRAYETTMCTTSTTALEWLHYRMPVLLTSDEDIKRWCLTLDGDDGWERCIKPCEDGYLVWHPVTTKVNRADYRASDAVKPTKRAAEQNVGSIAALFAAAAPPAKKQKHSTT